ncbi:LysR family transcriptional regulator [Rhizobium mayense]|uniref:LysR family transcriptional regulator n=1 Tax=Rhizobium mayense TaxID=1312184 RepID=A0ABT7JVC7_9HYPH|nr:LysR family transcriptional regulator [Rhizobium mayense]MDL2399143.1 LysR family transcriptional regulator [Rhizobium mayense]
MSKTGQKTGLVELNAVAAVAAARNFRVAARELGMSASALSHAIATLEARMGVKLFNRTTRSVSLTEAGEEFLSRVGPALREISDAMEAVNQFRATPTGTLRINTAEGAARGLLMPFVLEFHRRFPDVHVDIVTEGKMIDIVADGFDAGIRIAETVPQDMVAVMLKAEERLIVTAARSYIEKRGRPETPQDLLAHDCIRLRLPSGTVYRWEFERHGQEIRLDVQGPMTLQSAELMLEAVLGGAGIGYMTERTAALGLAEGKLVHLLEDWTPPFPGICLYYPRHRHVPAGLKAFVGVIREMTKA